MSAPTVTKDVNVITAATIPSLGSIAGEIDATTKFQVTLQVYAVAASIGSDPTLDIEIFQNVSTTPRWDSVSGSPFQMTLNASTDSGRSITLPPGHYRVKVTNNDSVTTGNVDCKATTWDTIV